MANNEERSSLQGLESAIFDLVGTGAATEQWIEWLNVPLQHAAAVGDLDLMIQLQRAGANGNALRAALKGDQVSLARDLLKRGASVIWKDDNGDSPLHLAAALGDEETVSLLLEKGALLNVLDRVDRAPLHVAVEKGRLAAVNVLLAAGADTNLRYGSDDESAMFWAAAKGHVDIVTALIRSGAGVNATASTGSTALHTAAYHNEVGVIDVLVEAGANVNAADDILGSTPLHLASDECCAEAIVALVKNGARVEQPDIKGQSPLQLAVAQGDLHATKALLAAGADLNATRDSDMNALHLAISYGYKDMSRVLVQAGADVNATDKSSMTALHHAASVLRDPGIFRVLIEAGATVDAWDLDGQTPLHRCLFLIKGLDLEVMAVLLECGADPNEPDASESSPLHLVACDTSRADAENAVDLLLRWGADETAVNDDGLTPLETAEAIFGVNGLGRLRDLLTQAPFDRNWRRRGWLLLYRVYLRRMRPIPGTGAELSDRAKRSRARSVLTEVAGGASAVLGRTEGGVAAGGGGVPGDWSGAVTWLVGMELEGVFRNVVKYL